MYFVCVPLICFPALFLATYVTLAFVANVELCCPSYVYEYL